MGTPRRIRLDILVVDRGLAETRSRAQALILAGKALALLDGRPTVACEDVRAMAKPALRHRILPSFFTDSEGTDSDDVVAHLLEEVPETP